MIKNVVIIRREDLPRDQRNVPIESIGPCEAVDGDTAKSAELILFVDFLDGDGRIKVLKNRCLMGTKGTTPVVVPRGTIIPSDWFDTLVCRYLDLDSPRVVLP